MDSLINRQTNNMKYIKIFCILAAVLYGCINASKNSKKTDNTIRVNGIIEELGMTSFQYGTHRIDMYVIKSETIDLHEFLNEKVTVSGKMAEGYPIEGGPILLIVEKIEKK